MKYGFPRLSPFQFLHQKIGPAPPEICASCTGEHAFDFSYKCDWFQRRLSPGASAVKKQTYNGCVLGPEKLFGHPFESTGNGHAHGQMKHALGQFDESLEMRSPAGKHQPGGNLRGKASALQFVADE